MPRFLKDSQAFLPSLPRFYEVTLVERDLRQTVQGLGQPGTDERGDEVIWQVADVVMGYEDHPAIRPDQDLTNPTIAQVHVTPRLGLYLQHATNEIANEIAVAHHDLVLVLSLSALKVSVKGFFGLFFILREAFG